MTGLLIQFDADDLAVPAEIEDDAERHLDHLRVAWDVESDDCDRDAA